MQTFLILALAAASASAADYAGCSNAGVPTNPDCTAFRSAYTSMGAGHTANKYCGVNTANCREVCDRASFTDAEKTAAIDRHNELRKKVANGNESGAKDGATLPWAQDMMEVQWDQEMADLAQLWLDQCIWDHDSDRSSARFGPCGQNLAYRQGGCSEGFLGGEYVVSLINAWYNEVKDYNIGNVAAFNSAANSGVVGHFTQVIWGKSSHVGCAKVKYEKSEGTCRIYYGCNYGPAGNYVGSKQYYIGASAGEVAGQCLSDANSDGLCDKDTGLKRPPCGGDKSGGCSYWGGLGYCTEHYVAYMKANCCATCNALEDAAAGR